MGLDNYWELPEGVEEPTFLPELNLCGGMLSGHGQGSFRGKVYDYIVQSITGVSLYEDKIDNATVCRMAERLGNTEPTQDMLDDGWGIRPDEYRDLVRMFKVYAELGATLVSWY